MNISTNAFATAVAAKDSSNLKEMFAKPLIIGASVSADWSSLSPGKKLALRYTDASEIKTIAQGGRPGRETLKLVGESQLKDKSIVIGVDLFFWDSTHGSTDHSVQALHKLMDQVSKNDLPIVLGEIPELISGRQPGRQKLNKEIAKACAGYSKCYLMPFDQLHRQVLKDGYLTMYGKKYSISQIVPDGLHLAEVAGNFLADEMLKLLN